MTVARHVVMLVQLIPVDVIQHRIWSTFIIQASFRTTQVLFHNTGFFPVAGTPTLLLTWGGRRFGRSTILEVRLQRQRRQVQRVDDIDRDPTEFATHKRSLMAMKCEEWGGYAHHCHHRFPSPPMNDIREDPQREQSSDANRNGRTNG